MLPLYTLSHEPAVGFAADAAARVHCAPGRGRGHLWRRRAQHGQRGRRRLCRAVAGGGDLGGARQARGGQRAAAASPGQDAGLAVADLPRDHLRAGACSTTRRARPRRIARVLARCRSESRPVYIELPRDMVGVGAEAVAALPAEPDRCRRARRLRRRDPGAARRGEAPVLMVGVEVRRYGLEDRVARARAPAGRAGGHQPSWAAGCSRAPTRRCSAPTSAWPATRR